MDTPSKDLNGQPNTGDTGPHGERRVDHENRSARKAGTLIGRDYGEPDLGAEALAPGNMVQGSDGNPVTGKP